MIPLRLKNRIENHSEVLELIGEQYKNADWGTLSRTIFNKIAKFINKKVTKSVFEMPEVAESGLIMGNQKLESILFLRKFANVKEFTAYYKDRLTPFCWISGKSLQSYWLGENAKEIKLNVLCLFLDIPVKEWHSFLQNTGASDSNSSSADGYLNLSTIAILKKYYLGDYFLYYPKTDGSAKLVKTPFVLKEIKNGDIIVISESEGHRYTGKVKGVKDGCLYIDCQNLDWEEMEQYIFNIGLETKPEVLFGVSNTVSVRNRKAIGLKNVLVKQKNTTPEFEKIPETEIQMDNDIPLDTEDGLMLQYFKTSGCNIILTKNCRSIVDLRKEYEK